MLKRMAEPLISIALCTYNGEKYLKEQLDSIIDQTYRNLEIIIVDDCSLDSTFGIIKKYAGADKRIKYYQNEVNLGYNKNFERAIGLATGDYISISDQDDIWMLDKIEILLENLKDNWLVFSNSEFMEEDSTNSHPLLNNFSIEGKDYRMMLFTNYVAGHSLLFKREFLAYLLPFPEYGFYDWWMSFVAFYHHKMAYVDKVLTRYRKHSDSVIQKILKNNKRKLQYLLFKINVDQYTAFESYRNLTNEDRKFISDLKKAFILRLKHPYSIPLIKIINKDYDILFSESKPRKGLSRLNFAMKTSGKVRNDK
jgi:glycosyltransferase involved in cell wall biosynthesis